MPVRSTLDPSFSALQRAENSSILDRRSTPNETEEFQCSSASRKFLNLIRRLVRYGIEEFQCSSASRKFLNYVWRYADVEIYLFQCSSASRKFLNSELRDVTVELVVRVSVLFSEPKIPQASVEFWELDTCEFQCSSASRKFLNCQGSYAPPCPAGCFSALQRAENSSIHPQRGARTGSDGRFSALQRAENSSIYAVPVVSVLSMKVSVLFSEPKIPQFMYEYVRCMWIRSFSALQRAENSSISVWTNAR